MRLGEEEDAMRDGPQACGLEKQYQVSIKGHMVMTQIIMTLKPAQYRL